MTAEPEKKNKLLPIFFAIIFALTAFGVVKILITGESSFRTVGTYTAESNPIRFYTDLVFLSILSILSLAFLVYKFFSIWK